MLDWLQAYWGAVVAGVVVLGGLKGLAEYLKKEVISHAPLRAWIVQWLVMPRWHDSYRDWLGRQLDRLHDWMGGLWSGKALGRCLAIAFAYPIALMLVGYGFGGPSAVGRTSFLPAFGDYRQFLLGFSLLAVMGGLGVIVASREHIDAYCQTTIAAWLAGARCQGPGPRGSDALSLRRGHWSREACGSPPYSTQALLEPKPEL